MNHCNICGHLEQNHMYGECLHCNLIIHSSDKKHKIIGYCGFDTLKYLEKKSEI